VHAAVARLGEASRAGDTIARTGERELAVIGDDLSDAGQAEGLARRALALLGGAPVAIGLAVADGARREPAELLDEAASALARAQERRGGYDVFDAGLLERAVQRARSEADLRHAIASGELRLHYQPIVDVEDGLMRGVEALVRWEHPEHGLLGPNDFVPVAEESGAIVQLGDWVLRDACRQAATWHAARPGSAPFWIAVNVSARQLLHPAIAGLVQRALTESGLAPELLHLDVAEADLAVDPEATASTLRRLRAIGVRISIDDASPRWRAAASDIPVDAVKVGPEAIEAVLAVRRRDVEVVAQRVEDREHEAVLRKLGCELAQGFLYARPAPAGEIEALLDLAPPAAVEAA
jgi:EAL domain-containing protein (putative c-di-GMP-specific phosphodiesterase class I)